MKRTTKRVVAGFVGVASVASIAAGAEGVRRLVKRNRRKKAEQASQDAAEDCVVPDDRLTPEQQALQDPSRLWNGFSSSGR